MNLERLLALIVVAMTAPQVFGASHLVARLVAGACLVIAAGWLILQWFPR